MGGGVEQAWGREGEGIAAAQVQKVHRSHRKDYRIGERLARPVFRRIGFGRFGGGEAARQPGLLLAGKPRGGVGRFGQAGQEDHAHDERGKALDQE